MFAGAKIGRNLHLLITLKINLYYFYIDKYILMIQAFFYDPIFDPIFRFLKNKRFVRYCNYWLEKKCLQLKRSPRETPLIILLLASLFGIFFSLLAKLPIWKDEISNTGAMVFGVLFFIASSVAIHARCSKIYFKLYFILKLKKLLFLLLSIGIGTLFLNYVEENILLVIIVKFIIIIIILKGFLLILDSVGMAFSRYINYAYKYIEKDFSAEYVWKMLKNLLYMIITLMILSLWHWIQHH